MSTVPTVVLTVAAVLIVALALRDVFDTLFHESGRAVLSRLLMRGVWRVFRRLGGRERLSLAGPIALIVVVVSWAAMLGVGWGLILMPPMPGLVAFSTQPESGRVGGAVFPSLS